MAHKNIPAEISALADALHRFFADARYVISVRFVYKQNQQNKIIQKAVKSCK